MPCLHVTFTSTSLLPGRWQSGQSRNKRSKRVPPLTLHAIPRSRRDLHASLAALLGLRPLAMGESLMLPALPVKKSSSDLFVLQHQQIRLQKSSEIRLLRQAWGERVTVDLHLF